MTQPRLEATIRTLRAASRVDGTPLWRALANELERAKRRRVTINLSRINRHTQAGDIVAVPGKVLAAGALDHPVIVAAFSFSEMAREKIALAEGGTLSLVDLLEEGKEPSMIRILK